MTKDGWLQFRAWFFAEEPCSFLGLRLWELDKNSLSAEAIESVEAAAKLLPDVTLSTVRNVSSVAHCILEWVLALHGYYWAHRAMAPLIDATALLKELTHDFASQCDVPTA